MATGRERGGQGSTVPERVGVIGGGRMGAGIAQAFLVAGARVEVVEAGDEAAEAARGRVGAARRGWGGGAGRERPGRRGKLTGDVDDVLGRLTLVDSAGELSPYTGLVVE